jgi:ABC transport system ATP-binding/permease protein
MSTAEITLDRGVRIDAIGLTVQHRNGTVALDDVTLTVEPGVLTAVIGPSGAGKSTLLAALAGITPAQQGTVGFDAADPQRLAAGVGFVPQDDILHTELSLRRTLRYAAALRIAASRSAVDSAVDHAMNVLGLARHADVPVGSLSGGQRKRASIAGEILMRPGVCFLDEPTSGLDPATAADLVTYLRRMCADGSTVVFTTHSVEDISRCDRVVVLAPGGRLIATGTPEEVLARLGADDFVAVYQRMHADEPDPRPVGRRPGAVAETPPRRFRSDRPAGHSQWWTLTRRAAEILTRNRLTLAILLGSPAAVITMFAILFRRDSFAAGGGNSAAAVQISYWLSFAGFFFGLTFGLLQVCTEVSVLRMERHAGVRIGAYVGSKLALLAPILLLVNAAMIAVLRALDRIPSLASGVLAQLYLTMALNTVAALCLGLCTSALVNSTAQAALALPMLCFPAVLFSGAMVPLPIMTGAGHVIAAAMPDRWAFEAIAKHLDVAATTGSSSPYATLGASSPVTYWALLAAFAVALGAAAYFAVRRRANG